jgi:hypothetical protein
VFNSAYINFNILITGLDFSGRHGRDNVLG